MRRNKSVSGLDRVTTETKTFFSVSDSLTVSSLSHMCLTDELLGIMTLMLCL